MSSLGTARGWSRSLDIVALLPVVASMSNQTVPRHAEPPSTSSLVIGTGLTLASLILVPALSQSLGLGPSLTSAVRVVLMKAAARV